jgi:hypothetical protein
MSRPGAYKSEKRKKELLRKKKQEEKRQKRFGKGNETCVPEGSTEATEAPENKTDTTT